MVGPSGVGKTSLLAAMGDEFTDVVTRLGCQFSIDGEKRNQLHNQLLELQAIASGKKLKISNDVGIKPNIDAREYDFHITVPWKNGKKNETMNIPLRFIDLPGEWYQGLGNSQKANHILSQADVALWCVDATALMENDGEYNDHINQPSVICGSLYAGEFFKGQPIIKGVPDMCLNPVIHFVLMRAESYIHDMEKLKQRMQAKYGKYMGQLKGVNKQTEFLCSAVQTVGNVIFFSWENEDTLRPQAVFMRNTERGGYSPAGCVYPLGLAVYHGW